jgi:hypothetical protein
MNKKAILVVTMILGLVLLVPLVAASPLIQNGGGLKTQSQTKQGNVNCGASCVQDGVAVNDCQQSQVCLQDGQCLNDCECNDACVCAGEGNQTRTQTRERLCQQKGIQTGMVGGQQNCGQMFQGKNCQAP